MRPSNKQAPRRTLARPLLAGGFFGEVQPVLYFCMTLHRINFKYDYILDKFSVLMEFFFGGILSRKEGAKKRTMFLDIVSFLLPEPLTA